MPVFVIQKHDATRLHYDFRLEVDGVLVSWAVPKGPSLDPKDHRLAMAVEDHPMDWGDFEGVIPKGEYGAGPVIIWDRGTYEPVRVEDDVISFVLHGEKLQGRFTIRRFERGGENAWLLSKAKDEFARPGSVITDERPESVASGRTIAQLLRAS
jgi:bifunctional non-homologous end joining protein LigD